MFTSYKKRGSFLLDNFHTHRSQEVALTKYSKMPTHEPSWDPENLIILCQNEHLVWMTPKVSYAILFFA